MKRYVKPFIFTILLLLMLPFVAAAGNESDSTLTSNNSVANSQSDNDANQARVSYSDDDDDGYGDYDDDDDGNGDYDDDDDGYGDYDDDDDGDFDDDDDGYGDYDDDDDGYGDYDDDDDGYGDYDDDDDGYRNNPSPSSSSSSNSGASNYNPSSSSNSGASNPSTSSSSGANSSNNSSASSSPVAANASCQAFNETGFSACDDSNAGFLSAVQYYGLQNVGYPISARYSRDGFVTQAFQKAILQWRPNTNTVAFVNVFDELHNAGLDQQLLEQRQTPNPLPAGWDGNASFEQVVQNRQALLTRPALRAAYFAASEPLTFFGLPTSEVQDMGNHYAIRLQRVVLQEWKEAVPWAAAGQVTIANGGDIAKELGFLPY